MSGVGQSIQSQSNSVNATKRTVLETVRFVFVLYHHPVIYSTLLPFGAVQIVFNGVGKVSL